jgi:hypothetical protein
LRVTCAARGAFAQDDRDLAEYLTLFESESVRVPSEGNYSRANSSVTGTYYTNGTMIEAYGQGR